MDVYSPGFSGIFIAPDQFQKLLPGEYPIPVAGQKVEKFKLLQGQEYRLSFHINLPGGIVNDQVSRCDLILRFRLDFFQGASAKQGFHPGQQLPDTEGLADIIVGAHLQSQDLVNFLALGGQHNHRHSRQVFVCPQAFQHLNPVHAGQHIIQQHQIHLHGFQNRQALFSCLSPQDFVSIFFQIVLQQI